MAKHRTNCKHEMKNFNKQSVQKIQTRAEHSMIFKFLLTDDILEASDTDAKDSSRGRTDSSNISRAFSPHPTVKANKPIKETIKMKVKNRQKRER